MTISIQYETGDPEALCTTLGAWFERLWSTNSPTIDETPKFRYENSKRNWPMRQVSYDICFNMGKTRTLTNETSNDRAIIGKATAVVIDIMAPTQLLVDQTIEKINNIIAENDPGASTRILKSDNSHVSKISRFLQVEIDFVEVPSITQAMGIKSPHMQGIIDCFWQKNKS